MKNLRQWSREESSLSSLTIAADARLSRTDYTDDQSWDLRLGTGDDAALALQGQAGGRAGLISMVPMWQHEHHIIYQAQTYAEAPYIRAFAPDFIEARARILPQLELAMNYWVMESHAVGGVFLLHNSGDKPITLQLHYFGHVGIQGQEQLPQLIQVNKQIPALSFGKIGNLEPVMLMEKGQALHGIGSSPKLGAELTIAPGKSVMRRWIFVGLNDLKRSIKLAQDWLELDWQPFFAAIGEAAAALPKFKTEDDALDLLLALSTQRLAQAFLRPAGELPGHLFVGARLPNQGYSPRRDGRDFPRTWAIQDATLAYQIGQAAAAIYPPYAQDMIRNALAKQDADGAVDLKTSASNLREGLMATPVLARLAWQIYEVNQDLNFLKTSLPGLMRFFKRWLALDADQDGLPEWQDERQLAYVALGSFGIGQSWSQGADIRFVEAPSLLAFLISEAEALMKIAEKTGDKTSYSALKPVKAALYEALESLWTGKHYSYRDRDHHRTQPSISLLSKAAGDVPHKVRVSMVSPARMLVRVVGGTNHQPRLKMTLTGEDTQGKPLVEVFESSDFLWQYRQGIVTSSKVFAQLHEVRCEGLSRVYQIYVDTVDTTALDLTALLPLWLPELPASRRKALLNLLTDEERFWRSSGLSIADAESPVFDPSSADGEGGVWPFWQMLLVEGLLQSDEPRKAGEATRQYLEMMQEVWQKSGRYGQFYHSDQPQALGERNHLAGIAPLSLLQQIFGIMIVPGGKVWIGGPFPWGKAVTIEQHGVVVRRTRNGARIRFASGESVEVDKDAPWQLLQDPGKPAAPEKTVKKAHKPASPPSPPIPPQPGDTPSAPVERISIEVEHDE